MAHVEIVGRGRTKKLIPNFKFLIEMIQHLFKLIWKRRKSNFLIMLEVFVAFIILFAVGSLSVYCFKNYLQPSGIKTENVWAVYVDYNSTSDSLNRENGELLSQKAKSFKEIEVVSFDAGMFPFGHSHSNRGFKYKGKSVDASMFYVDETYPSVLGLEMVAGTWFKNTDTILKNRSIVITQTLKEELFGNEDAIGKEVGENEEKNRPRVVGVIQNFKHDSDFQGTEGCIFEILGSAKTNFLAKTTPSVSADFEAKFAQSLRQLGKNWNVEILHLTDMKAESNELILIPLIIALIVCGFLIVNVALGLFGVLFQNIARRRSEIGLRRAMGATGNSITKQFVGEMLVLATFAIGLGVFFAIQFPILNVFDVAASVYIGGIVIAVLAVYLLVILCAWVPSRQAAMIHPAMALHEE